MIRRLCSPQIARLDQGRNEGQSRLLLELISNVPDCVSVRTPEPSASELLEDGMGFTKEPFLGSPITLEM